MICVAEKIWTIGEILLWAEEYLDNHYVPESKIGAEYLLSHVLGCKRVELHLSHGTMLDDHAFQTFQKLIDRRAKREPLQYIIGEQEFWGLTFKVNKDVLIPRPETEILVEKAIKTIRNQELGMRDQFTNKIFDIQNSELRTLNSELHILDLCTGSGCIAICLAKEISQCRIFALDISEEALRAARDNAERHGVLDKITFVQADLFEPFKGMNLERKFDVIVSNPPYVSKRGLEELQPEIFDHEPTLALYGGKDGLYFYRRIIAESPAYLSDGGYLMLEMGYGQAEGIKRLVQESSAFECIDIKKDFAGIKRIIRAQRKG